MNKWIIAAAIMALLVTTAFIVSTNVIVSADKQEVKKIGCSGCNNECNAERNCGLETCTAVSGKTCGCRK